MEKTFIILKPDCMEKGLAGQVLQRFEKEGFQIVACKMSKLGSEILREHYAHVADLPFFPDIEEFMSSRTVIFAALEGENVIARVRELLGPTDSTKAPAGTIRGDFGTDMMRNVVHASDGPDTAAAELKRFFADDEIYS
ncbi:nucleoside-diphosphate kinase [Pelagicoccus mobilis]|uniref:Nucleoside diphosphate kinase n=1 Tax=Pelagicoccus mobilis TaxID=415221 RepID=A0A934S001_9BACT|nr:nucleoside-diphosphate kinase [Pelagicoccus mobilis]MBK1878026.1 nucleoside-diphosphate kinase [Pelagicoccus mobilis]